jgi:hypothetical protein
VDLKVNPGDPITASYMNRIVDRLPQQTVGFPAIWSGLNNSVVEVLNNTGAQREIGNLIFLSSYDGSTTNVYDAIDSIGFVGIDPIWHTKISKIGICVEPIPNGERGKVIVDGLALLVLESEASSEHTHAFFDPIQPWNGKSSYSGFAKIIETFNIQETETDQTHWAWVLLGHEQNLWRYRCGQASAAPAETPVMLRDRRGNDYHTINLLDPLSIMSDQVSGNEGWCIQCGNEFEAIQAPCV